MVTPNSNFILIFFKQFKIKLSSSMLIDLVGCWIIENICKYLFADLEPKPMVTRGRERREKRRAEQARLLAEAEAEKKRV